VNKSHFEQHVSHLDLGGVKTMAEKAKPAQSKDTKKPQTKKPSGKK